MGASTWHYFTPFHPKPSVAFRRLRQHVFATGQYRQPASFSERMAQVRNLPSAVDTHRQTAARMRDQAEQVRQNPTAYDRPEFLSQIAAYRAMGNTLPPLSGSPVEQLTQYFEALAEHSDRLAALAEAAQPSLNQFLDAIANNSSDGLPDRIKHEFQRFQQLRGMSPVLARHTADFNTPPGSIEELLAQAGESGTHSILDITRCGQRPRISTAFPLRPDLLTSTFGTTEPTHAQVENSELAFAEALNWQAVYFAVYQDSTPVEWAFVGSSGD